MLIMKVGEPVSPSTGDIWFDPTTMMTKIYQGQFHPVPWATVAPTLTTPGNPSKGSVYVDALSLIPHLWDGYSWVSAVPQGYQFPPTNPTLGTTWIEQLSGIAYLYYGGGWIPLAMLSGSTPPQIPQGKPVGNWQPNTTAAATPNLSGATSLTIAGPNGDLVTIDTATGQITYGPGYTPDAAAQVFWKALAGTSPRFLQTRIEELIHDLKDATACLLAAENELSKFKAAGYKLPEPTKPVDPLDAWERAMGIVK